MQDYEDIIDHIAIQSRSSEDRVLLSLSRADDFSFSGTLSAEEAESFASDLAAAAMRVRQAVYRQRQAERAAQALVDRETKTWMLLTAGSDERGELVHVVWEYSPSWPNYVVATVPLAEGQAMRDAHNTALGVGTEG